MLCAGNVRCEETHYRKNIRKAGLQSRLFDKERIGMASSKEYLDFVLEHLSGLDGISCRAMMGEYILYYKGKIIGGIYDDRFLVKNTAASFAMMPDATLEKPYEGAKEMLLVEAVDDRPFLQDLLTALYDELPAPKKKS